MLRVPTSCSAAAAARILRRPRTAAVSKDGHEDAPTTSSHSRGAVRPSFASFVTLRKCRGRREGRVAAAPGAPAQRKFARAQEPQVQAVITPAFPARWFYGLYALSSVNHPVCHRRPHNNLHELGARSLGRQDHTTSPSASVPLVNRHIHVHRIPASRLVTIAKRPSESEAGYSEGTSDLRK